MLILNGIRVGHHSKVLITGMSGFTGIYLSKTLEKDYECFDLGCNLLDIKKVHQRINEINPDYVIHLAANGFTAEKDIKSIYEVNVIGSINLLDSIDSLKIKPKKVILSSTAQVYGSNGRVSNEEDDLPMPLSHYGCSKLSMENLSQNFHQNFPIIITRPFNYTGVGHNAKFIIPKIVNAFVSDQTHIELGNIDVSREFNDVRDIAMMYKLLLESNFSSGVVNLCSGDAYSLNEILSFMTEISSRKMEINFNPLFARLNDISKLSGDTIKLSKAINFNAKHNIKETLEWMYQTKINE